MDVRELVKKLVADGVKQVDIAKNAGISQGTVYKLLYTETKPTLDIIVKLSRAYGLPVDKHVIAETPSSYSAPLMTDNEKRILQLFKQLDNRRQIRAIEMIEDMALAFKDSHEREGPAQQSG